MHLRIELIDGSAFQHTADVFVPTTGTSKRTACLNRYPNPNGDGASELLFVGAREMATTAYIELEAEGSVSVCILGTVDDFAIEMTDIAPTVTYPDLANDNVLFR